MHFGERHTRVHRFGPSAPPVRPCARACQRTTGSNVSADAVTNIVIIDDINCTLWTSKESPVALLCRLVNEVAIVISPCIVANNHHIFVNFHSVKHSENNTVSLRHVLEISPIGTSCMRFAHQSCRHETGRLHVRSLAPIISTSCLAACTLVTVNKRDVHRVEQATFGCQATACKVCNNLLHAFTCFSASDCLLILALCVADGACSYHTWRHPMHILPLKSYMCSTTRPFKWQTASSRQNGDAFQDTQAKRCKLAST